MKNIILTRFPNQLVDYSSYYMMHVDKDLNIITKRFTSCRESFCEHIRNKLNGYSCFSINTNRLYVLITFGKSRHNHKLLTKMEKSLKLVNSFERYYKWATSKIRIANDERNNIDVPAVLFISNRNWVTSPYLVSFYTLLIRLGKHTWLTNTIVNETDHKKLITKLKKACSINNIGDAKYILQSIDTATVIISNYNKLFKGKPKKYHWSISRLGLDPYKPKDMTNAFHEGITNLANGFTYYKELYNKCINLIKEENDKKK